MPRDELVASSGKGEPPVHTKEALCIAERLLGDGVFVYGSMR